MDNPAANQPQSDNITTHSSSDSSRANKHHWQSSPAWQAASQRAQAIQDVHHQWQQLLPKLQHSVVQWQQANTLARQMLDYYQNEWLSHHELEARVGADERDQSLVQQTHGDYSVMGEDTLWEVVTDYHELMTQLQQLSQQGLALYPKEDPEQDAGQDDTD